MSPISTWGNLRLVGILGDSRRVSGGTADPKPKPKLQNLVSPGSVMRPTATHQGSDGHPVAKMARSHVKAAARGAAEVRMSWVK